MKVSFSIIPKEKIEVIIPLVQQLTNQKHKRRNPTRTLTEMTNKTMSALVFIRTMF